MLETRMRKQGRSIVVTLPADENVMIEADKSYLVSYNSDGSILLIPKIENPFLIGEEKAYYEKDIWEDMKAVGGERLDEE